MLPEASEVLLITKSTAFIAVMLSIESLLSSGSASFSFEVTFTAFSMIPSEIT